MVCNTFVIFVMFNNFILDNGHIPNPLVFIKYLQYTAFKIAERDESKGKEGRGWNDFDSTVLYIFKLFFYRYQVLSLSV